MDREKKYAPYVIRNNQVLQVNSSEVKNGETIFMSAEKARYYMEHGTVPPREKITLYKDEYEAKISDLKDRIKELEDEVRKAKAYCPYHMWE